MSIKHLWRLIEIRKPQKSNRQQMEVRKKSGPQFFHALLQECEGCISHLLLLFIYYIHQKSGGLDCLSSLLSSTGLPRAWPRTAFIASWASCWPKDPSPWLLKCLSRYEHHLQLPARNLGLFCNGSQDCPALMMLDQIELELMNDDSGMDPAWHCWVFILFLVKLHFLHLDNLSQAAACSTDPWALC